MAANVLVGLVSFGLLASGAAKLAGAAPIVANFEKFHLSPFRVPIGVIEIVSVLLFAVPKTSSLGTLLLTGYFGGAIVAHLAGNDAGGMAPVLVLGLMTWGANYLRNRKMFQSLTG